jgi:predicted amidohydrolase
MFSVALLQLESCGLDQEGSRVTGERACRQAKAMGADLALFPEMWNIGYTSFCASLTPANDLWRAPDLWRGEPLPPDPAFEAARDAWLAHAIGPDDRYVAHFRELARELEMAIALTYLERWPGAPRNTVSLIDRHGEIVLTYAKVHTCDFDYPEAALTPGDAFPVCHLDTARGPVAVGAMICYDREFPESARILMVNGAEIILVPNACEMEANRLAQLRGRAMENMTGLALANYAAPAQNGHSVAYDGIAFDSDSERSRDMLIVEAGEREGIHLARFDLDRLRSYRARETWGNAFRRPRLYAVLTSPEVAPPFVRINRAGMAYHRSGR